MQKGIKMSEPYNDLLWHQYKLHIDLYKHYLELVIKFNLFYYAVTGAILSFYFSNPTMPFIGYSLLFPILLSLFFAGFFLYGAKLMNVVRNDILGIRDKLNLYSAPEVKVLAILLRITAALFIFVAICMGIIFYFHLISEMTYHFHSK